MKSVSGRKRTFIIVFLVSVILCAIASVVNTLLHAKYQKILSIFHFFNDMDTAVIAATSVVMGIVAILIAWIVTLVIQKIFLKPIFSLEQKLRSLSSELDIRPRQNKVSGNAIDQCGQSLDMLSVEIKKYRKRLKQEMADHSKELQRANELLRMEMIRRRSQEGDVFKLSHALEQSPNAVILLDEEALVEYVNPKFEELTGFLFEDCRGNFPLLLESKYGCEHRQAIWMAFKEQNDWSGECQHPHKDGSAFAAAISFTPIKDEALGVQNFLMIISDISVRKQFEDAMGKMNQELMGNEQKLRNSFEELKKMHEQLKKAQMKLVQAEKLASIGQLAAGVAHEINSPLGFLSSNINMLKTYLETYTGITDQLDVLVEHVSQGDLEKAKRTVQAIESLKERSSFDFIRTDTETIIRESIDGVGRLTNIVSDLSSFAREVKDEEFEKVSLEKILDSVLTLIGHEVKYKAKVIKNYQENVVVWGNGQRLGQVFINILINAAQSIEYKGQIGVSIYKNDRFGFVEIVDSGCGIDPKHLDNIFDAFFTTKPIGKGTGLGLSISYEIIKKHDGDILVESDLGRGSKFTVSLPLSPV